MQLTLGADHPWRPLTDAEAAAFPIEAGNQGGFHIEPSLRLSGSFDPDAATINMRLGGPEGTLAQLYESGVLLWLSDGQCDYDLARLVLVDGAGGLMSREAMEGLAGEALTLEISISSALGEYAGEMTLRVRPPAAE